LTILGWKELLDGGLRGLGPAALTVGVFDGLHLGHRRLLEQIAVGFPAVHPVVVTFSASPAAVQNPTSFPGSILTLRQKLERLETLGAEAVVVVDFSDEMSNLSGEAFVRHLRQNLTIQKIVVGQNFRFGKKRTSGTDDLKEMLSGTEIQLLVADPVRDAGEPVSSSRIRSAVQDGRMAEAARMLGAPHELDLRDLRVQANGAGIRVSRNHVHQVLPRAGTFAVVIGGPEGQVSGSCGINEEWLTLSSGSSVCRVAFT
jgi:riboflavin kinase/FMN adenylyltransferase